MELDILFRKYLSNDSYTSQEIPASNRLRLLDFWLKSIQDYWAELQSLIVTHSKNDFKKVHHLELVKELIEQIITELKNESNIVKELIKYGSSGIFGG